MANVANDLAGYQDFDARIQHNSDTWSYNAAHPDHTIVLAGPARYSSTSATGASALKTIGAFQSFVMSSAKPWQPYQPIGQIATAFLGGKTQNQAQISRLLINYKNLLASLYDGAGTPSEDLNNIAGNTYTASGAEDNTYWINLDNPIFHVPIGLAMVFRTKSQATVGGVYMELAVIQSFQTQIQMGQAMILENVGLIFDRALPLTFYDGPATLGLDTTDAGFSAS